jgi:hypothetical protein
MLYRSSLLREVLLSLGLVVAGMVFSVSAATFDIAQYGATPNDDTDDTLAVLKALEACGHGGGIVYVPAGTFLISRQGAESPILPVPSNTVVHGDGPVSTLKLAPGVMQSNFWRLLGNAPGETRNIAIRDLCLDGSNTLTEYKKGVPEHNHGVFLYAKEGLVENVLIERLLVENFSGDCIAMGQGCRNITIRDVALRNFLRQGIQMAGGNGARDYLVTGCHDLEHSIEPGGSTIHVEHANGLRNVQIIGNRCRKSILAGGVDGILIRDNVVTGRIEGNGNTNCIVAGNLVRGVGHSNRAVMQLGYAENLIVRDNILQGAEGAAQTGLYVWGNSKYNPNPSRNVTISGNLITVGGEAGISLNGIDGATVGENRIHVADDAKAVTVRRGENVNVVGADAE